MSKKFWKKRMYEKIQNVRNWLIDRKKLICKKFQGKNLESRKRLKRNSKCQKTTKKKSNSKKKSVKNYECDKCGQKFLECLKSTKKLGMAEKY